MTADVAVLIVSIIAFFFSFASFSISVKSMDNDR